MPVALSAKPVTRKVLVHGLVYFGGLFAKFMSGDGWDFRFYPDSGLKNLSLMALKLQSCDIAYQIGGRVSCGSFLKAARLLGKKKIVMHWVGSDTLDQQREVAAGRSDPWVTSALHHWAESDWLVKEAESLGVACERVPFPSSRVPESPSPLPETFRVLVYMPTLERARLYGLDLILEAARKLPFVPFDLVGLLDGPIRNPPPNLTIHGRLADLEDFFHRATVLWRPVQHDGVSWMVLESLGHGRHVLWTYPFPGCIEVKDAAEAIGQIERLYRMHRQGSLRLNEEGVRFMASDGYNPLILKQQIRARLERILRS